MKNLSEIPKIDFRSPSSGKPEIEVLELEGFYKRMSQCQHDPSQPHRIKFHCLIYITQAEGAHFIDFNYHPYQAGSFIFINKNQIHAFNFANCPHGKIIFFSDDFIDKIRSNIRMPLFTPAHLLSAHLPVLSLNKSLKDSCEALLCEINKEIKHEHYDNLLIQMLFSSLLLKLTRERQSEQAGHLSEARAKRFASLLLLIEKNFTVSRDASVYADRLHITYKSLNQICKLACNQTAKQLIDAHTILEAKRKLIVDNYQIQQLAYQLGFDEVTNFVKYFKRHTLMTPSQFKDSFKG